VFEVTLSLFLGWELPTYLILGVEEVIIDLIGLFDCLGWALIQAL